MAEGGARLDQSRVKQVGGAAWWVAVSLAIAVCLFITGLNLEKHNDVLRHLELRHELDSQEEPMQQMESTWVSDGVNQKLTTPRKEAEPTPAWAERHREALEVMKNVFPPDPPAGS